MLGDGVQHSSLEKVESDFAMLLEAGIKVPHQFYAQVMKKRLEAEWTNVASGSVSAMDKIVLAYKLWHMNTETRRLGSKDICWRDLLLPEAEISTFFVDLFRDFLELVALGAEKSSIVLDVCERFRLCWEMPPDAEVSISISRARLLNDASHRGLHCVELCTVGDIVLG